MCEQKRQRAALERHPHRVVDSRIPSLAFTERDGNIERRKIDIGKASGRQDTRHASSVTEREWSRCFRIRRCGQRDDAPDRAHWQLYPIVLGHATPADESDPPARSERVSHMGKCPCRIVEEHHPETREKDVKRALGQLGVTGVGHLEQDRRILRRKLAGSSN